jgi:hypothetical protein
MILIRLDDDYKTVNLNRICGSKKVDDMVRLYLTGGHHLDVTPNEFKDLMGCLKRRLPPGTNFQCLDCDTDGDGSFIPPKGCNKATDMLG